MRKRRLLRMGSLAATLAGLPVGGQAQGALPTAKPNAAANLPIQAQAQPTAKNAADSALDAHTTAVATQLRCPVCQGESIQESPSELSQQMRTLVREQLAAGKTPDEVKAYFVSKYGEWILLAPPAHGFNLVVYLLPVVLLIGGCGAIALLVRRWTAAGAAHGLPSAPDEPAQ